MSPKSLPISALPSAMPHFGKYTCASSANRSRMLPPVLVTPLRSKALRYSSATDLRCSSVMVRVATAMVGLLSGGREEGGLLGVRRGGGPVGEGDDRSEGGAAGPVGVAGRGRDAVAHAVEPGDHLAQVVEDLAVRGGARSALGVERAAGDQGGVVRAGVGERPHGRVGPAGLLLDGAVEDHLDRGAAA